ncbi:MAG: hypothetical protein J5504_05325 [Butyrivibrio sp.]|nr:hypothetical protein [Butyrivibrio sp.]
MFEQKKILIVMIIAGLVILATLLWRAIYSIKHKGDEKALEALTKAQAASSWTVWFLLIIWDGSIISFKEGTTFTVNNIGSFILILLGVQCLFELYAGYYYTPVFDSLKASNSVQSLDTCGFGRYLNIA